MERIKIILADDHPLIREGFRSSLRRSERFEILDEVSNGVELVAKTKQYQPDIVLADISMPEKTGLMALLEIHNLNPKISVIILSMHEEREYVLQAIQAGAKGYLSKTVGHEELALAIETVFAGGKYYSAFVTGILAESLSNADTRNDVEITTREHEILRMVATGASTKQIAADLNISIRTVESHRINLLRKLKVNNSAELIRKAIERGLL